MATSIRPSFIATSLGSRQTAERVASRAREHVTAYRQFLNARAIAADSPFDRLPVQDKASYLRQYPFAELLGDDFGDSFTVFSSAGSGGHAFYWPQLKSSYAGATERLRRLLEGTFAIDRHRTLAVVGLALGSWIGGDVLSWSLKNVAVSAPYPFAVFSPGNKHDEIIAMLNSAASVVDRLLLVCCPSAIGHLMLRAEQLGQPLPLDKLRYVVIGEPFAESFRADLEKRSGVAPNEVLMMSVYGSADTGVLGFESAASIALRKLCEREPGMAAGLGIEGIIPHFFHHADPETYLETVDDELCITRWQGIPLVRYNLHDQARLYDWLALLRHLGPDVTLPSLPQSPGPGIIAISGRADTCLILCGTKLTEAMLDDAVHAPELSETLSGAYRADVVMEDGRQRLALRLECRTAPQDAASTIATIYPKLVRAIGRAQPEFLDDWNSIYRKWDEDPQRRILRIELVPWPDLSRAQGDRIKQYSFGE